VARKRFGRGETFPPPFLTANIHTLGNYFPVANALSALPQGDVY